MSWIQPLAMQTWILNVFAERPDIFGAIAILVITTMAGYFRMNGLGMFLMLGVFVILFSGFIAPSILILFAILGGLLVGYALSKIFE